MIAAVESAQVHLPPKAPPPASPKANPIETLQKTVSASRLTTFLQCRLKFYFRYVQQISKPKTPSLHVGSVVHLILQAWNMARWRKQAFNLDNFKKLFEEGWKNQPPGIKWEGEEDDQRKTAWSVLEMYFAETPIKANEMPEAVEVPMETDLSKYGLPTLIGILDLVRAGGRIVDFKSAGKTPDPEDAAYQNETQLSCYSVLYREATGDLESGRELHHLVKTKTPKLVITELPPMTDVQRVRLFRMASASRLNSRSRMKFSYSFFDQMASSLSFGISSPFCHDHTPAGNTAFVKSVANKSGHAFESGCAFNGNDSPACVASTEFNKATTTTMVNFIMLRAAYLIGLSKSTAAFGHFLLVGGDSLLKQTIISTEREAPQPLHEQTNQPSQNINERKHNMGLTIHYSLKARGSDVQAHKLIQALHQTAQDLPFKELGNVVDLSGGQCDFEKRDREDPLRWLLIQAADDIEIVSQQQVIGGQVCRSYQRVQPLRLIGFKAWPGEGCEASNFGLCKFPAVLKTSKGSIKTKLSGWRWGSFCKTQYASDPRCGGVPNFLQCHLTVIAMLDKAKELGCLAEVSDEGDYWEKRDLKALVQEIGSWNEMIAAFGRKLKDLCGGGAVGVQAPITEFLNFEQLEAAGQKQLPARPTKQETTPPDSPAQYRAVGFKELINALLQMQSIRQCPDGWRTL